MEVLHTHSPYLALCISSIWLFLSCILYKKKKKRDIPGSSVVRLYASTAGGLGSISGQGTKIPHAPRFSHKILIINHKMQVKCSLSFTSCSGK